MTKQSSLLNWTVSRFLRELASAKPAPGGGSAAALVGAIGVGLGRMVGQIVLRRKKSTASKKRLIRQAVLKLEKIQRRLERLAQADAAVYAQWMAAAKSGKGIARARLRAITVPVWVCEEIFQADQVMRGMSRSVGSMLQSDLRAGLGFLSAAYEAAWEMVKVNLKA